MEHTTRTPVTPRDRESGIQRDPGRCDGETRTRTGDTAIFQSCGVASESARCAGLFIDLAVLDGVQLFPHFALVCGMKTPTAGSVGLFGAPTTLLTGSTRMFRAPANAATRPDPDGRSSGIWLRSRPRDDRLCVFPTLTALNLTLGDQLASMSAIVRTFVLAMIGGADRDLRVDAAPGPAPAPRPRPPVVATRPAVTADAWSA